MGATPHNGQPLCSILRDGDTSFSEVALVSESAPPRGCGAVGTPGSRQDFGGFCRTPSSCGKSTRGGPKRGRPSSCVPSAPPREPLPPPRRRLGLSAEYHHSKNLKKNIEAGSAYFNASKKMNGEARNRARANVDGERRGDGRPGGSNGGCGGCRDVGRKR